MVFSNFGLWITSVLFLHLRNWTCFVPNSPDGWKMSFPITWMKNHMGVDRLVFCWCVPSSPRKGSKENPWVLVVTWLEKLKTQPNPHHHFKQIPFLKFNAHHCLWLYFFKTICALSIYIYYVYVNIYIYTYACHISILACLLYVCLSIKLWYQHVLYTIL